MIENNFVEKVRTKVNKEGWIVLILIFGKEEKEFVMTPETASDLLRRLKYKSNEIYKMC